MTPQSLQLGAIDGNPCKHRNLRKNPQQASRRAGFISVKNMNQLSNIVIQPWLDKAPKYSLQVSPATISFTDEQIGSTYEQIISIKNNGYVDLPISKIPAVKDFILSPKKDSTVIKAGDTFTIGVSFYPATEALVQKTSLELVFGCGVPLKLVVPITVVHAPSP